MEGDLPTLIVYQYFLQCPLACRLQCEFGLSLLVDICDCIFAPYFLDIYGHSVLCLAHIRSLVDILQINHLCHRMSCHSIPGKIDLQSRIFACRTGLFLSVLSEELIGVLMMLMWMCLYMT